MKAPEPSTPASHDTLDGSLPATLPLHCPTISSTGKSSWVRNRITIAKVIVRYLLRSVGVFSVRFLLLFTGCLC
jgi:hypothetical protein